MNDMLTDFLTSKSKYDLTEKVMKYIASTLGINNSLFYFVENNKLTSYAQ